jgi:hypothetical protein
LKEIDAIMLWGKNPFYFLFSLSNAYEYGILCIHYKCFVIFSLLMLNSTAAGIAVTFNLLVCVWEQFPS